MGPPETEAIEKALQLLREGRTAEGVAALERIARQRPEWAEAWGHLSWQYALAGRQEDSLRCLDEVLRLRPGATEALWRRGDRLVRLGRLDEAASAYRSALEKSPDCHDARLGLKYIEYLRRKGAAAAQPEPASMPEHPEDRKSENEQRAKEHFARGDRRLASLPLHLHIETTTRCNAACITCAKGYGPYYAEELDRAVFERIERELFPAARLVNLTGSGEPLMARRFDEFYEGAARAGARVYLVTNATLLTTGRLEKFARRPTDLIASIDGARRETFEAIRRRVSFDRVIEALRFYKKLRDIYPDSGSTLGINFVAMRRNIEELPALVDLAAELGARFIAVLDFATGDVPPEIAAEHLSHHPEIANRAFDEAAERARERGIALLLPPKYAPAAAPSPRASLLAHLRNVRRLLPERGRFPKRCPDPWMTALVSTSGLVHPCCASRRVMGDLSRQSFEEIWNGRRYRWFRRRINSFLPPPECRLCNQLWGINAGNPSAARSHEGLIVKALYAAERKLGALAARVRRLFSRPSPPPEPNYFRGRPIRKPSGTPEARPAEGRPDSALDRSGRI